MIPCVSNIAWQPDEEPAIARALQAVGLTSVEVAPMRAVPEPWRPDRNKARSYRAFWEDHGIAIVALQALLFGRDGMALFTGEGPRYKMRDHLIGVLDLAAELGARRLVFGSPGQRRVGTTPTAEAWAVACAFFADVGAEAAARGACLCIEPNPPQYGCDWVTDAATGARLVREIGQPGFGLHLDAAGMLLAGDDGPAQAIDARDVLRHFHFSAPHLAHVDRTAGVDYAGLAAALGSIDYGGHVSIEMRAGTGGQNLPRVVESVAYVLQLLAA